MWLHDLYTKARAAVGTEWEKNPRRTLSALMAVAVLVALVSIVTSPAQTLPAKPVVITRLDVPAVLVDGKEDFAVLATRCAPNVHPQTLRALVTTESTHNPFAIAVVNGRLDRVPKNRDEAVATIAELERQGFDYSVGLTQVNNRNFAKYGQTAETLLNACTNLRVGADILKECYDRALLQNSDEQQALLAALSCYYSGNFQRGFVAESNGTSYVGRVVAASGAQAVPAIAPTAVSPRPAARTRQRGTESEDDWAMYANDSQPGEYQPLDQN